METKDEQHMSSNILDINVTIAKWQVIVILLKKNLEYNFSNFVCQNLFLFFKDLFVIDTSRIFVHRTEN